MIKHSLCLALLLGFMGLVRAGPNSCVATPLSRREAERLVLAVPEALAAAKVGGKVTAIESKSPHSSDTLYYFMLISTVSSPTTPLGNGVLGYFSVNKINGRILNVVNEEVAGGDLEKLQARLRAKHCIGLEPGDDKTDHER